VTELALYDYLLWGVFATAALTAITLLLLPAPYGRHQRKGWGPTMGTRAAWVVMESPAVIAFFGFYACGARATDLVPLVLLATWQSHYLYRTFIYPMRLRPGGRPTPVAVVAMGFLFNTINAYLNARFLSELGPVYETSWLLDPRFLIGVSMFVGGMALNRQADRVLLNLRKPGESGYKIPRGGAYNLISCPNYFGETVQWLGWALACWSLAGLSFAVFTAANLIPRALAHHRWYHETFPDYPKKRRAVIPWIL